MNGRMAKKIRREARKRDTKILPELKEFLNNLPLGDRIKAAWRIVWRKF